MSYTAQPTQWQSPMTLHSSTPIRSKSTPTLATPTSAPKPTSSKDRKLKLRASCDACAASKVKCSKNRPICTRCSANGMQCVYGVSRKHGKPGRTRKRNPDGTPFIKASKQRPSPDGREFGKFRLRTEPTLQPLLEYETTSNWSSNWSPTPSLPGTPDFDFEMTPEPFYMESTPDLGFMDDMLLPASQFDAEQMQAAGSELSFRDPFAKAQSGQFDFPSTPLPTDFARDDSVGHLHYVDQEQSSIPYHPGSEQSTQSFSKDNRIDSYDPIGVNVVIPPSHSCYTLAYSTLGSLSVLGSDATTTYSSMECKDLDNVLSIARLAIQSVQQLLKCSCSSDPHLAMLYSSIASKILTWYRIAAGANTATSPNGPSSFITTPVSAASSAFPSPRTSQSQGTYSMSFQPLHFDAYHYEAVEQQRRRKQVVLQELKNCGQLVDALANWRGDGSSEQCKFLYDMLGTWLKSEMYKTVREVEGAHAV